MKIEWIKPIPKNILTRIYKLDLDKCPDQKGAPRWYSYLTSIKKELVKITVAVKNYRKKWYCKQVAAHGVKSDKCCVKDMEYGYMGGMGFRVGWYAEGLQKYSKWYEDGKWYYAPSKAYNPWAKTVNPEFVGTFPAYRYSAYRQFEGRCVIEYLKLYEQYPQTEYLLKLGLHKLHDSVTVLKRVAKDKAFCKWLIAHKDEIAGTNCYVGSVMESYKTGRPIKQIQAFAECKKKLEHDGDLKQIKDMFETELERFLDYLRVQNSTPICYKDYLKACNYLGLDMNLPKNRFPHDFKRWHDIRIDEYHSAKAVDDEKKRAELYAQFANVAQKYVSLQKVKTTGYAVMIAASPVELTREGEALKHCVGRMGYDQKMVRQESLIFFVRDIQEPDVPFVTVEYSLISKKVLQVYGYDNKKPDESVLQFVSKVWLPYANRNLKKIKNLNEEDKAA